MSSSSESETRPRSRVRWILGALAIVAACSLGAFWIEVWGPDARAREVADVLAHRAYDEDRLNDTPLDFARKKWIALEKTVHLLDVIHDVKWATTELNSLARWHPAALAHAAETERDPDVRFALLDAIESKPAYADAPRELIVEHVTAHAILRLDRDGAKPLNDAQRGALAASKENALSSLRAQLVHGHCGALTGYEILGVKPLTEELLASGAAIAAASADPASDLSSDAQESCRVRIAKLAAPTTDGGFHVIPPKAP